MTVEVTVSMPPAPSLKAFLQPSLVAFTTSSPFEPRYETPIGRYFEREWVKEAQQRKWKRVTQPPSGINLYDDIESGNSNLRPLDLVEWENDIIMCSL